MRNAKKVPRGWNLRSDIPRSQEELEVEGRIQQYIRVGRKCDKCEKFLRNPEEALNCLLSHGLTRCLECFQVVQKDEIEKHNAEIHQNNERCCPFCREKLGTHDTYKLQEHVLKFHNTEVLTEATQSGNFANIFSSPTKEKETDKNPGTQYDFDDNASVVSVAKPCYSAVNRKAYKFLVPAPPAPKPAVIYKEKRVASVLATMQIQEWCNEEEGESLKGKRKKRNRGQGKPKAETAIKDANGKDNCIDGLSQGSTPGNIDLLDTELSKLAHIVKNKLDDETDDSSSVCRGESEEPTRSPLSALYSVEAEAPSRISTDPRLIFHGTG